MIRRVLMTADAVGGVWTYALELARALGEMEIETHIATMGPLPKADQRAEAALIPTVTLYESNFRLEWMVEPWNDVSAAGDWLLNLSEKLRPDIVHLNGYCHASLDWRAPVIAVGHSCVLSWWRAVKEEHAPAQWRDYGFQVAKGLRMADAVVAPTHAMLDELRNCYGPLAFPVVIPNGRSVPELPCVKEHVILSAGRVWDEAKNIKALEAVADDLIWPVRIAGEGGAMSGNSRYLGRLSSDRLFREMAKASIFALPARYEPFGLSILEAALYGCALVIGDIPSLRETWDEAARFVDPNDEEALQYELSRLIESPQDRLTLARRALKRAKAFTSARMAQRYVELYTKLATTKGHKELSA
jgi:glycogen synthase